MPVWLVLAALGAGALYLGRQYLAQHNPPAPGAPPGVTPSTGGPLAQGSFSAPVVGPFVLSSPDDVATRLQQDALLGPPAGDPSGAQIPTPSAQAAVVAPVASRLGTRYLAPSRPTSLFSVPSAAPTLVAPPPPTPVTARLFAPAAPRPPVFPTVVNPTAIGQPRPLTQARPLAPGTNVPPAAPPPSAVAAVQVLAKSSALLGKGFFR